MKQLSYCGQYVKENDPDRFLLSLFCHYSCREALWALLAFNCEISKTREVVSDSTLGHIRLQWWKDEIAHIYNNQTPKAHEVLKPLYPLEDLFQVMIEYRNEYPRSWDQI